MDDCSLNLLFLIFGIHQSLSFLSFVLIKTTFNWVFCILLFLTFLLSLKQVAKQWYDYERCTFQFVKQSKEKTEEGNELTFEHQEDFDENGILYWIGTNGK